VGRIAGRWEVKKIKAPKHVWHLSSSLFGDEWVKWTVIKVLQKTECNGYLLCECKDETGVYEDGTPVVHVTVFDLGDDTLIPDNPKTRKLIIECEGHEKRRKELIKRINEEWLPFLKRIGAMEK
jgi:hypothetical protein